MQLRMFVEKGLTDDTQEILRNRDGDISSFPQEEPKREAKNRAKEKKKRVSLFQM